jgi:hypothetical protein
VLSSLTIGQYIPARTGSRAYLAHWAQTLNFYERREAVADFYGVSDTDAARRAFLREQGVHYVFHSRAERALGAYDPAHSPFLVTVYAHGETTIYQVRSDD